MLIDSHCHLTHHRFSSDCAQVIELAHAAGVSHMVTIATGIADAQSAVTLAEQFSGRVSCTVGLDPFSCYEARNHLDTSFAELESLLQSNRFVALGEFGLEYFHKEGVLSHDQQKKYCERQLDIAKRLNKPVILHVRDAHDDMLALLASYRDLRGVIHSFTGDAACARRYLDLGWHLSFNGMITFKNNDALRAAAAIVPADRLMVETDAPYLAPHPHRGQRCTPAMVAVTAEFIAELRGERCEDVAAWTTRNASLLFGLPLQDI